MEIIFEIGICVFADMVAENFFDYLYEHFRMFLTPEKSKFLVTMLEVDILILLNLFYFI